MPFDLKSYLKDASSRVEAALEKFMPADDAFPDTVHKSMRYSLFAGGKRIRPVLCLAGAEALGGDPATVLPVACAIEMIHTFSLIHDDLPAMDDDDFRRGKPTNHKVFGEAIAILAGDGLHAQAFIVLGQEKAGDPMQLLDVIRDIADATGSRGMVGGQVVDMESEGKQLTLEQLGRLHALKTGRLIAVSVTSGAKLVSKDAAKIQKLQNYGDKVGLAFQIADDILDIEGGAELGKDIGSDVANNKATYPSLMGLERAKAYGNEVVAQALAELSDFGPQAEPLRAIAKYIVERRS